MFLDQAYRYAIHRSARLSASCAAEELGISQGAFNSFTNWRKTGKFPSDELCLKIAEYIDWDYEDLLIAVMAARQEHKGRKLVSSSLEKRVEAPDSIVIKASEAKAAHKLKKVRAGTTLTA